MNSIGRAQYVLVEMEEYDYKKKFTDAVDK